MFKKAIIVSSLLFLSACAGSMASTGISPCPHCQEHGRCHNEKCTCEECECPCCKNKEGEKSHNAHSEQLCPHTMKK